MTLSSKLGALSFFLLSSLAVNGCAQNGSTPTSASATQNATMLAAQNARIREVGEAMEGGGWNVYGNGFLGDWFVTPKAGKIKITVRAAGDPSANVFPVMRLWVNEKLLQTFTTDSTDYKEYSHEAEVPAGITRVEVEFTNDTNGEIPDRNLRVMSLAVSDSTLNPTVPKIGAAEIAQYRMGDLIIKGKAGTRVKIKQLRHEFPFGTALNHEMFQPRPAKQVFTAEDRKMFGDLPPDKEWTAEEQKKHEANRQKYLEIARTWFNAGVHENAGKWYHTEKRQGELNYADADRVLQWAQKNEIAMRGHTLFWAVDQYTPAWAKALENDALEAKMKERTNEVMTRYQGRIDEWDVNNEMLHGDYFGQRLGARINSDMFKWAKAANPDAILYMNDFSILSGDLGNAYFNQIKTLQAAGAPIGGVGFQGHFRGAMLVRPVKRELDRFATLGLPMKVTEYDMVLGEEEWRAKALEDLYRTCFAHPGIAGITMWGFWDGSHWNPGSGLFNLDWTPKMEAKAYHDLVFKEWWTNEEAVIPKSGVLQGRAFYGRQQIEYGKKKIVVELQKSKGVKEVRLK